MAVSARGLANSYLDLVNAKDLEGLVNLFDPEAMVLHPVGVFEGRAAIRGFYADNVLLHSPQVSGLSWVEEARCVVFEMEARTPNGVGQVIDHLTANNSGKIERLAIYYR